LSDPIYYYARRRQAILIIVIIRGITIISSLVSQRQVTAHASPQSLGITRTAVQSSAPSSTKHSTKEALFISSS
jgi:uncharacterized membrane protein